MASYKGNSNKNIPSATVVQLLEHSEISSANTTIPYLIPSERTAYTALSPREVLTQIFPLFPIAKYCGIIMEGRGLYINPIAPGSGIVPHIYPAQMNRAFMEIKREEELSSEELGELLIKIRANKIHRSKTRRLKEIVEVLTSGL